MKLRKSNQSIKRRNAKHHSFRWQITEVQNISTENIRVLSSQVQDLSETKLRLEERIEAIEKDKMIMEKQVMIQNNWNQCEEIKFDTEDDDRIPTEKIDIEIKMEAHTAPDKEPENITSNEESNVEENPDE